MTRWQHAFSRRVAIVWAIGLAACLTAALVLRLGWATGLALDLIVLGGCVTLISCGLLSARTRAAQGESQALVADLQQARHKLEEYTAQAQELAGLRERNRLTAELHESVSQMALDITLSSQETRALLACDPGRVPEQLARLQDMTDSALGQLRSLHAQSRPAGSPAAAATVSNNSTHSRR